MYIFRIPANLGVPSSILYDSHINSLMEKNCFVMYNFWNWRCIVIYRALFVLESFGLHSSSKVVVTVVQILYTVDEFKGTFLSNHLDVLNCNRFLFQIQLNHCVVVWWVLHVSSLSLSLVFSMGNNAYGQCGRKIVEDEVYRFVLQQHMSSILHQRTLLHIMKWWLN